VIYGSICSGIEASSAAWHPLGWRPAFFSEIEPFPRAVLAHHYPDVPLHGDFTTIEADQYAAIDVLVGGTPCQSFSFAGLRAGLADQRGNLALEFCRLARRLGPRWVVWENVPGVLSLDGGRAFASILGGLAECGYGLAYRVLDAQYVRVDGFGRAVPQRRRRVFVVGCLGSWQRAAAVLFEREGLRWDSPPSRQARQDVAGSLGAGSKRSGGRIGRREAAANHLVAHTLNAKGGAGRIDSESESENENENESFIAESIIPLQDVSQYAAKGGGGGGWSDAGSPMFTLQRASVHGVAVCFDETQITSAENRCNPQPGDPCHPLVKGGRAPTLAFRTTGNDGCYDCGDAAASMPTGTDPNWLTLVQSWRVRRLMPVECERLQGFPDGYTAITYRGKPAADGPRYKALGNSMAVNVMRWIGTRIAAVDAIDGRAVA